MEMKPCPHCRKGKQYVPGEILPYDCTSCNGTGYAGEPLGGFLFILGFTLVCAWVLYRAVCGMYD